LIYQNKKKMQVLISIQKVITKIEGNKASLHKISAFNTLLNGFSVVVIDGTMMPAKKQKYHDLMITAGYSVKEICWENEESFFEGANPVNFRIIYAK
jgi:hypothetical protein